MNEYKLRIIINKQRDELVDEDLNVLFYLNVCATSDQFSNSMWDEKMFDRGATQI